MHPVTLNIFRNKIKDVNTVEEKKKKRDITMYIYFYKHCRKFIDTGEKNNVF